MGHIPTRLGMHGGVPRRLTDSFPRMMARALVRRCPRCGSGGWFHHWFRRAERCPGCGIRIERQVGFMLGSITVNTIVTFGLLLAVIVVGFVVSYPDVAVVPMIVVGIAIAVLFPLLFFPFSHTIWAAVDFAMRPVEPHEAEEANEALLRQ